MFPSSIKSLRHSWSHPHFTNDRIEQVNQVLKEQAKQWLENFATNVANVSFENILFAGENGYTKDEDCHCEVPLEFWFWYETYTGKPGCKAESFSCTC